MVPTRVQDDLVRKEEIRKQIEEGWQSARRGEFGDADEVFDRIDAELESMERSEQDGAFRPYEGGRRRS